MAAERDPTVATTASTPTRVAVLSSARWASFKLSKHSVSEALAELGHEVLYVDPPWSHGSLLRDGTRREDRRAPVDEAVAPRLDIWRPRVLPGQNLAVVQLANASLLRRGILARIDPGLVIAFSLEARSVFTRLPGVRVYYCTDSNEDLPGADASAARHWEAELVRAADMVVACSLPLVEQLERRGADVIYLPHGCDATALADRRPVPSELAGLPRPLVGYVGSFNFRLDPSLLAATLDAASGGTLVLVGGGFGPSAGPEVAALLDRPDVRAVGHQSSDALPSYIGALDLGLVPYTMTPFNRKSFPIKVLQYLAAGLPVVSTPNGATDELGIAVHTCATTDEWRSAVATALATSGDEGAAAARRATASARPWSQVAHRLLAAAGLADDQVAGG